MVEETQGGNRIGSLRKEIVGFDHRSMKHITGFFKKIRRTCFLKPLLLCSKLLGVELRTGVVAWIWSSNRFHGNKNMKKPNEWLSPLTTLRRRVLLTNGPIKCEPDEYRPIMLRHVRLYFCPWPMGRITCSFVVSRNTKKIKLYEHVKNGKKKKTMLSLLFN